MENDWVTILTLDTTPEAHLAITHLKLKGIEVRLLDELTTQLIPALSPALGGARIQVKEKDVEESKDILREFGHNFTETKPNPVIKFMTSIANRIPIVCDWRYEAQMLFVVVILAMLILFPIGIYNS